MVKKFIDFVNNSPSSYQTINSVLKLLKKHKETCKWYTKESKNGKTLIAYRVGDNINENSHFNIIVSHSDSPWFKITGKTIDSEGLKIVETIGYGGIISSSWLDRPLTLAGRVLIKKGNRKLYKYIHLKKKTFIIPNLSYHFQKYKEDDLTLQGNPIIGSNSNLYDLLNDSLKITKEQILDFDLNFIQKTKPELWGDNEEFLSSGRLDNLASVYSSLIAFIQAKDDNNINVLYIADNEEIGSNTDVGACSGFLKRHLKLICKDNCIDYNKALEKSFMISADNAQGCTPHFSYIYNSDYKVFLNKGIVIKNSERYATTEQTQNMYIDFCKKHNTAYQIFYNRNDIPGGGTLGKIIQKQLKIKAIDLGIAQFSMHSSYETIGSMDIGNAIKAFTAFYKYGI